MGPQYTQISTFSHHKYSLEFGTTLHVPFVNRGSRVIQTKVLPKS